MESRSDTRVNFHHQMLVDVGVVLCRAYGADYARAFLLDQGIAERVVDRVVTNGRVRSMMHRK